MEFDANIQPESFGFETAQSVLELADVHIALLQDLPFDQTLTQALSFVIPVNDYYAQQLNQFYETRASFGLPVVRAINGIYSGNHLERAQTLEQQLSTLPESDAHFFKGVYYCELYLRKMYNESREFLGEDRFNHQSLLSIAMDYHERGGLAIDTALRLVAPLPTILNIDWVAETASNRKAADKRLFRFPAGFNDYTFWDINDVINALELTEHHKSLLVPEQLLIDLEYVKRRINFKNTEDLIDQVSERYVGGHPPTTNTEDFTFLVAEDLADILHAQCIGMYQRSHSEVEQRAKALILNLNFIIDDSLYLENLPSHLKPGNDELSIGEFINQLGEWLEEESGNLSF